MKLFSHDPLTDKTVWFHTEGDDYILETRQEVSDLVELTKAERAVHGDYQRYKGDRFHRIARFPLHLMFDPVTGRMKDDDEIRAMLRDPLLSAFKTVPGTPL